jgi:hypothetical protein
VLRLEAEAAKKAVEEAKRKTEVALAAKKKREDGTV